jgi:hypothetical protein
MVGGRGRFSSSPDRLVRSLDYRSLLLPKATTRGGQCSSEARKGERRINLFEHWHRDALWTAR